MGIDWENLDSHGESESWRYKLHERLGKEIPPSEYETNVTRDSVNSIDRKREREREKSEL